MEIKENINNKLYWEILDEPNKIFSIKINSGNYTIETLKMKVQQLEGVAFIESIKLIQNNIHAK